MHVHFNRTIFTIGFRIPTMFYLYSFYLYLFQVSLYKHLIYILIDDVITYKKGVSKISLLIFVPSILYIYY